jgi:hypothetical protein
MVGARRPPSSSEEYENNRGTKPWLVSNHAVRQGLFSDARIRPQAGRCSLVALSRLVSVHIVLDVSAGSEVIVLRLRLVAIHTGCNVSKAWRAAFPLSSHASPET